MQSIKARVFNNLTKNQKSELCHYVAKFVQKNAQQSDNEILFKYLEEEQYYLDIDSSRHPWIVDFIDEEEFQKELTLYINDCKKKLEIKESQKPYVEKQKALAKEQRKKAQEFKMSKEPATKAQISYYKALSKKYGLVKDDELISAGSKLDLRNKIDEILKTFSEQEKQVLLTKIHKV